LGEQYAPEVHNFVNQLLEDKHYYFCDFMRDPPDEIPEGVDLDVFFESIKVYEEVTEKTVLQERILNNQTKYNDSKPTIKLDLVLFDSCLQHILRISRVIRTPKGHCLLVGVGGSGK